MNEHGPPPTSADALRPRMWKDLRLALSCLYTTPTSTFTTGFNTSNGNAGSIRISPKEAHDFLIHLQTRNIRRKIQSLRQRQQDVNVVVVQHQSSTTATTLIEMKSSWLACIYTLCQSTVTEDTTTSTERLFCAQTLLHRLMRAKLAEAVDWEVEQPHDLSEDEALRMLSPTATNDRSYLSQHLEEVYRHWMRCINPFVSAVLDTQTTATTNADNPLDNNNNEEERVKGELSLLTVASIVYMTASQSHYHQNAAGQSLAPILSTLGASMALIALRLRYTPYSLDRIKEQHNSGTATTAPPRCSECRSIVTIITNALAAVWSTVCSSTMVDPATGAASSASAFSLRVALHACLGAIPDTILGSPGGVRGRISTDPRCLQAAAHELRTVGLVQLWEAIQHLNNHTSNHYHNPTSADDGHAAEEQEGNMSDFLNLSTFYSWAKYLPLPTELVHQISLLINKYIAIDSNSTISSSSSSHDSRHHQCQRMALACVIAVCEGGSWTLEQVLSYSLGFSEQQMPSQPNKKRQSSKSKKRHKDLIDTNTTDVIRVDAVREVQQRGEMACLLTSLVWPGMQMSAQRELSRCATSYSSSSGGGGSASQHVVVDGEGPIGCLAASANACLPHLIRTNNSNHNHPTCSPAAPNKELFLAIAALFQDLCGSPSKSVRILSFEALYTLYGAVTDECHQLDESMESIVVEHFFACSMRLAVGCGYPSGYFDDMSAHSDEDLEIERNDVRDLLRTLVAGRTNLEIQDDKLPTSTTALIHSSRVPLKLLERLLKECEQSLLAARELRTNVQEVVVHAFSSLAKPLNQWATLRGSPSVPDDSVQQVLDLAMSVLQLVNNSLLEAFNQGYNIAFQKLLPLSRIANIATASLAPMIGILLGVSESRSRVVSLIDLSVRVAATSIDWIPELAAESTLGRHQYDIRGTMRGPGGEDHVGCLLLMRLVFESDDVARVVGHLPNVITNVCALHHKLKEIELARGKGIMHGKGVTPKSRRILLGVLCHVELKTEGQAGAAATLSGLFHDFYTSIASFKGRTLLLGEVELFQIAESALDLASFPPEILCTLFNDTDSCRTACLEVLASSCIEGYQALSVNSAPDPKCLQWNRIRASLFYLLKLTANPDLPVRAAEMICVLIKSECDAINRQCLEGPLSKSNLFHDDVISSESVPAGIFVRVLSDVLQIGNSRGTRLDEQNNCVSTMHECRHLVLSSFLLHCSDPIPDAFCDPRPVLGEAWLIAVTELVVAKRRSAIESVLAVDLLCDTFVAVIMLLLYSTLGRTVEERSTDPGPSLDGPHSLALTEFLSQFFSLGPEMLYRGAEMLAQQVPVDFGTASESVDLHTKGVAIVGAALFRASQGGLPPWAVESIPEVYRAFFVAMNRQPTMFEQMLRVSMKVRLVASASQCGGVKPGSLLSGRYFESLSETATERFVQDAMTLCRKDDAQSWRRLKVVIKQACGGKKKDSDFQLKPSCTRWDFDRI